MTAVGFDAWQLNRLNESLTEILAVNEFYRTRLSPFCDSLHPEFKSRKQFASLPLTLKQDLVPSAESGQSYANNRSHDVDAYCRFHRTSGTLGHPMIVLDTADDWHWWMETWQYVLDAGDVEPTDRVMMAFSFGPFIGFWSAFDAAVERGCLVAPTGAMSTLARLDLIDTFAPTVVFCTPSYALHMAAIAKQQSIDLRSSSVRAIIVAGEPGGSIPSTRGRIESEWGAKVVDHAGASEVGPWGFPDADGTGMFVNEAQFFAEFIDPESGEVLHRDDMTDRDQPVELVLTTLGRYGSPVIRYCTGDLVRPAWRSDCPFAFLRGGVLGRADDMMIIRGVNVFPGSIENILRSFPEIDEFRMTATRVGEMDQLEIEVEDRAGDADRIVSEIEVRLGLRVEVRTAPPNSLPRFEAKGKRFIDNRKTADA